MTLKDSPLGHLITDLSPCSVDLGARGGVDEDLLSVGWATDVIGFEPEPDEAARLSMCGDSRWRSVTVLPFAVGGHSGSATLNIPASNEGASLLPHNPAMVGPFGYENLHIDKQGVSVETVTLDDLHATGKLPRTDYLKIDIEGAELAVLRSARTVLSDCVAMKVECSFLEQRIQQPLIWDVATFLLEAGFAIVAFRDIRMWRRRNLPAHPYCIDFEMPYSRGQLAQCDLIVLKTPDAIASSEQALRLVVLSAVLGYFDYAVNVLRAKPELQQLVVTEYRFDLENELKKWSHRRGRKEVASATRAALRSLIPLTRSLLGKLPYPAPTTPY